MKLTIGWLFPTLMSLYGDRGNVLSLQRRAEWRGIFAEVVSLAVGDRFDPDRVDIVFFGGGQDREERLVAQDLVRIKGPALQAAIDDGLPALAICGGYQLLGEYYQTAQGERLAGLGILPVTTVAGQRRLVGNIIIETDLWGADQRLVGFENHSGCTHLNPGARPLGRVLQGHGNNGRDCTEGVIYRQAIGTYLHGALLPKNPALADFLLQQALSRRYGLIRLESLDDRLEQTTHDAAQRHARTRRR